MDSPLICKSMMEDGTFIPSKILKFPSILSIFLHTKFPLPFVVLSLVNVVRIQNYTKKYNTTTEQGRRQKNIQGGQRKKDRKIAKNTENSTLSLFREANGKKNRKITLLGLYLLYLYDVRKSRKARPHPHPLLTPMQQRKLF